MSHCVSLLAGPSKCSKLNKYRSETSQNFQVAQSRFLLAHNNKLLIQCVHTDRTIIFTKLLYEILSLTHATYQPGIFPCQQLSPT
jgi:hypothetical protein